MNIFKLDTEELKALALYTEILKKNMSFPKYYWTEDQHQQAGLKRKCSVLARYCLENLCHLEVSDLKKYDLKELKAKLIEHKLSGMIQIVFKHDMLEILKNSYPSEFKNGALVDWYWSKHGIWHDDNAIINAVKDMVYKEGIRWLPDIPKYDWKKRLLKHGIYNVLAYFNWSIYALFNFVYPDKFHPVDFKYKTKWAVPESLQNAFLMMHKAFKKKRLSLDDIYILNTSGFRRLGLAAMLITMFDSSTLKAKEYYLYKTQGNEENIKEINDKIKAMENERFEKNVKERLKRVAKGKFIYNLKDNHTVYNYIKRHAKNNNSTIDQFIAKYGFVYKNKKKSMDEIDKDKVWEMRKNGLTYVQIAEELDSNPTTINKLCKVHFGGDPLIPRPINDYITVQELMDKYHVDHKTIMKYVQEKGLENHTTIRFRYLKKSEIESVLNEYISKSKKHISMMNRYTGT